MRLNPVILLSPIFIISAFINSMAQNKDIKNVIVVIIDGPRYSETWGDSSHRLIPNMVKMSKKGTIGIRFSNDQFTYTSSGHAAILTGHQQELENTKGTELPLYPSYLQYYRKAKNCDSSKVWLITSKDKLQMLSNCKDSSFHDRYRPSFDCGNNGLGTGYRNDTITIKKCLNVLKEYQPNLLFVNLREPDYSGHRKDWNGYLKGIRDTDSLVYMLFQYINENKDYKGNTIFIVTNDHGRHLDGTKEGFCEHGDSCEGCKHINLFLFGPGIKQNYISNKSYNQTDLTATIAWMLNLQMPHCQGSVMKDFIKK